MQKQHTYWALNSAKTSDEELDSVVDRIVSGLFSVVVTMGESSAGQEATVAPRSLTVGIQA